MTAIRYQLPIAPQPGPTAFAPVPARTTAVFAASMAQGQSVQGQPGTQGIPAPPDGVAPGKGLTGGYSATGYMPARWYPSLYYATQQLYRGVGGVAVYSDNLMPVPAQDPRGITAGAIGPHGRGIGDGASPPARQCRS